MHSIPLLYMSHVSQSKCVAENLHFFQFCLMLEMFEKNVNSKCILQELNTNHSYENQVKFVNCIFSFFFSVGIIFNIYIKNWTPKIKEKLFLKSEHHLVFTHTHTHNLRTKISRGNEILFCNPQSPSSLSCG